MLEFYSLGTLSCDLWFILFSESRHALFPLLNHRLLHTLKLSLIYISSVRGNALFWHLTAVHMKTYLIYILFASCDIEGFSIPHPLFSLCHVMTVHAPEAVMVLISLDCDCEDYDWTVTVWLGSVKLADLS